MKKLIAGGPGAILFALSLSFMTTPCLVNAQDGWDEMGPESEASVPVGPFGSEAYTGEGDVFPDMEPVSETGGPAADVINQGINSEARMHWIGGSGASPDPADMDPTTEAGGVSRAGDVEAGLTAGSMRPQTETGGPLEFGPEHTSEYRSESGGPLHWGTGADTPLSEVSGTQRRRPERMSPGAVDMTRTEMRMRRRRAMEGFGGPPGGIRRGPSEGQVEQQKYRREQEQKQAAEQISNPQVRSREVLEAEGVQTY